MAEKAMEIFSKGETVWPALLPGERPGRPYNLENIIGFGPFRVIYTTTASKRMPCREVHPQLLLVAGNNGIVMLFGCVSMLPGFCFTREEPSDTLQAELQAAPEAETLTPEMEARETRLKALGVQALVDSEEVNDEIALIRSQGGIVKLFFNATVEKNPEADAAGAKSLVGGDGSVPNELFTKGDGDLKFLKEFRIKIDEKPGEG